MVDSRRPALRTTSLSDDLARQYAPRIRGHAARYARRLPSHVPVTDLVSAGYVGLVDAFARVDLERSGNLDAYVDHRIRGAMLDELREHDPLTRDQRAFARKMAVVSQRLATSLGRPPDAIELAAGLGIAVTALHGHVARMRDTSARHQAAAFDEDESDDAPSSSATPDEVIELRQLRDRVNRAVGLLPARHRDVLRMHYDDGHTMRHIADALGVTESRVSQIHADAIARVRKLVVAA